MTINVIKRDGTKQPLDIDKFHKVVKHACEGISGVSQSAIELGSQIQFQNNMKSSDIQETLIKSAANMICEETPNYQHVAGRLVNYQLRKAVYGQYDPVHLYDHVVKVVKKGFYDKELLKLFTREEYDQLNKMIKHDRDDHLTYVAMEQFRGKYLVRNRVTGQIYETPQMAYILIAAMLFASYPADTRMSWIKKCYDVISEQEISLATPVLAGIRTPERQYSSCVLIESGDSRDSINAVNAAAIEFISARAGLGLHGGMIRAEGSSVQGGAKSHTGIRPFWRTFQSSVQSCSQGGLRPGAATMNWMFFHYEFEDLIVLKDPKQLEDNRLNRMDYCVHFNRLFYQRWLKDEQISLFSPSDIPEVVEAFYSDTDEFIRLYELAEANTKIRRKTIGAKEMLHQFVAQRFKTGRVYLMNVDHVNDHGSFISSIAPIKMTNLCVEITLPTGAISLKDPTAGEIAVCILCAINLGAVRDHPHMMYLTEMANRMLNQLIDFQEIPVEQAARATKYRRPIGIGVFNLAYWIAKNGMTFSQPDFKKLHQLAESYSYGCIYGSTVVAEEFGKCPGYHETKYSQGILPIDTYKKAIDEFADVEYEQDWELLRERLTTIGMANSTTMAGMPVESSSQIANGTSGFDPARAAVTSKQSGDGALSQVVPEIRKYGKKYEYIWDMPNTRGVLSVNAVFQKFMDQSISTNTSYNPSNYPDDQVPEDEMVFDILTAYKWGIKTLYYNNTRDGANDEEAKEDVNEQVADESQADCEGCAL